MKFLKNPIVAILLAVLIVTGSTLLSVNRDLRRESEAVAVSFYKADKNQPSMADNMLALCGIADSYCRLAAENGIDSSSLVYAASVLRGDVEKRSLDIESLCTHYASVKEEIDAVDAELSSPCPNEVAALRNEHAPICAAIDNSAYNDNALSFFNKLRKFPAWQFAKLLGIHIPVIFF